MIVTVVLLFAVGALAAGCTDKITEAQLAEEAGDLSSAEALYQEQLAAHPDNLQALKGMAGVLYLERRWNEALPVQERAVALDPKEAQIRVELGFNYLTHQNAAAKAVVVFKEAAALTHTAQHLGFLAQAQKDVGDRQAAELTLREALKADRTYGRAYDLLITLLEGEGRTAEADVVRKAAEDAGVALQTGSAPRSAM
jgi:predicted Zn-dependent protease